MAAIMITSAMVTAALEATAAKIEPEDANPFQEGDAVVYPAHGVGRIDSVGFEVIAGQQLNLIQISFDENRMTVRIPVARARAAGLRKLASRQTFDGAFTILKGRPRVSRLMWAKRAQEYLAKINTGDPRTLAEVVRDLQAAAEGAASSFSQRNLFELARDRLAAEWAAVAEIGKPEAIEALNQALVDARPTSQAEPPPAKVAA